MYDMTPWIFGGMVLAFVPFVGGVVLAYLHYLAVKRRQARGRQ
jgi:hypothetical protein